MPGQKTVIIIVGPTGVGKTAAAIELATHFHTEIISADSRQCFKELNIGVARPSETELSTVTHHFIASHSIQETVNAGTFERFALEQVSGLFRTHNVVIMTGGTGLYIKAFCEGMDEIPKVPDEVRNSIMGNYDQGGLEWLQKEVQEKDPGFYRSGEVQNPQRLMRALEVLEATGKSILEFRTGRKVPRDFDIVLIGLELPKEELQGNIALRTDKMIASGLVDEVKTLLPYKQLNALQTVGYTEIFNYLEGKISLDEATGLIKKNTRQYAKRQMTWFKKDPQVKWFLPGDLNDIESYLDNRLGY